MMCSSLVADVKLLTVNTEEQLSETKKPEPTTALATPQKHQL